MKFGATTVAIMAAISSTALAKPVASSGNVLEARQGCSPGQTFCGPGLFDGTECRSCTILVGNGQGQCTVEAECGEEGSCVIMNGQAFCT